MHWDIPQSGRKTYGKLQATSPMPPSRAFVSRLSKEDDEYEHEHEEEVVGAASPGLPLQRETSYRPAAATFATAKFFLRWQ
jgi:hypothetical protein